MKKWSDMGKGEVFFYGTVIGYLVCLILVLFL